MTKMLELTRAELQERNALTPALNDITKRVVSAMPNATVPDRMKYVIAISQLTNFAAQFKRNIKLWDDTEVPINAISFAISGSGNGKDSSVRAASKCFSTGFKKIESERSILNKKAAIKAAADAGEDDPQIEAVYKQYLKPIPPINIMPTTGPGLIQHINDIGDLNLSSGFMYAGEFSQDLATNPDMAENIKILSEVYDLGIKEAKYTKGVEHRSNAITGQPVSALFVGSPKYIFYDEATKKKFEVAFMSQLARRSWFCYTPETITEEDFDTLDEWRKHTKKTKEKTLHAVAAMKDDIDRLTAFGLSTTGADILVSPEAEDLFDIYKRYNEDTVNSLPNQDSTYALIRRHLQWKALKLAGAFAVLDESNIITERHYIEAIQFAEIFDKDMELFEYDLNKSNHERFSDYIRTETNLEGKATISIHDIKKKGFLSSTNKNKLHELVTLCAGYDPDGIYSVVQDGGAIHYERILKTDILKVSYKPINCSNLNIAVTASDTDAVDRAKKDIARTAAYGFDLAEVTFEDLSTMLSQEFAYSPFEYRNGKREKSQIVGGTKWLVLDIDKTPIPAEQAHFMLSDINHYIVLTSDPDNMYKYRVIIELDSYVELSAIAWKMFYQSVASDLALNVDPLPQSQAFYSYGERPMWSQIDAEPLEVRDYVMEARESDAAKQITKTKPTTVQAKALLNDPLTTFEYAFEAPYGQASRKVIQAMYHLRDLGGSLQDAIELFDNIQSYWDDPFSQDRQEAMRNQIKGLF